MAGLRVKSRASSARPVRWKPGRRAVIELDLVLVNDTTGPANAGTRSRA